MKSFTSNIIIKTTATKLWEALTSKELSPQYWSDREIRSEWVVGSQVSLVQKDGKVNWQGNVLSFEPFTSLSFTFDVSVDPRVHGINSEHARFLADEPISKVTFNLKPFGGAMMLTIIHDDLSDALEAVASMSWVYVTSSLKSLLETGEPLAKVVV